MEPSVVRGIEHAAFMRAVHSAFHQVSHPDDVALDEALYDPERSLVLVDDGEIVATTVVYARELTVPGAVVDAACVSDVGVLPTHRRRGLARRLMGLQLEEARERGEPVAALWATEAGIYEHFGFGRVGVRRRRHADHDGLAPPSPARRRARPDRADRRRRCAGAYRAAVRRAAARAGGPHEP